MIKPRKAETIWMITLIFSGSVDMKTKIEARIPEMGCVMCWNIEVQ